MEAAVNYYELKQELEALGFKDAMLVSDLRGKIAEQANPVVLGTGIATENERLRFRLYLSRDKNGRLSLNSYEGGILGKNRTIPHQVINGIDTANLEKRMQRADWKADYGEAFYDRFDADGLKQPALQAIARDLKELGRDEKNIDGLVIQEQLIIKYWSDSPAEKYNFQLQFGRPFYERSQHFGADVPVKNATQVLQERLKGPDNVFEQWVIPIKINDIFTLNQKTMNEQNLDFLKDNLKYLGFEDKLNKDLEKQVSKQPAEFKLQTEMEHYNNKTDHTLHFRKSSETDMYFLNKHEATLKNGKPEEDRTQTFYITKGHGVTAKEAFNLLEGRSVFKELVNKEKESYKAWLKIDFSSEKDEKTNNYKVKQFSDGYGYDLEKSLSRFPIKELGDSEKKDALFKSLQKGNLQQITVDKENKPTKFFIEASPQFKTINVFSDQHKTVKRETLLQKDNKNDKGKDQGKGKDKGRGRGI